MKKVLTLALAVLGFTAAQAVTVNWTSTSGALDQTVELKDWVKVTYTFNATTLFNNQSFGAAGTIRDIAAVKSANGSTDALKATISKQGAGGGGWHLRFYINGTEVTNTKNQLGFTDDFTVIFTANIEGGKYTNMKVSWENNANTTYSYNVTGDYTAAGTLGYVEVGEILGLVDGQGVTVTVVPEPTALALLALGVAGLALKRKHA